MPSLRPVRLTLAALAAGAALLAAPALASAASPGAPDPSFAAGQIVQSGAGSQLFGVAVQPNGDVVAAGQVNGSVLVQRYSPSGGLLGQYVGGSGQARGVAIQGDGKIVIAGSTGGAMLIERLTSGLTPDSSFGSGGAVTAFGGQTGVANGVAVSPDGSIVAVGTVGGFDSSAAVVRLSTGGSVVWTKAFDPLGLPYAVASGVAIQPDGRIVFAGSDQGSPSYAFINGLVVRLNADGSLDSSFAGGGAISYHRSGVGSGYTAFTSVALQNDGKIVAGGLDASGPSAIALRLNGDGSIDSGFGSGGLATAAAGNASSSDPIGAYGIAIMGGGRIVAVGNYNSTGVIDSASWAWTPAGTAETDFGTGGTELGPFGGYEACAVAIAPDGTVVTAGDTVPSGSDTAPCADRYSSFYVPENGYVAEAVGFGPPPGPGSAAHAPTVTTGAASNVSATSADIAGSVTPNHSATSYHFQYGTSTAYSSVSSTASAGSGAGAVSATATLSGLHPSTKYHYRIVASNGVGTSTGADRTFTTAPAGPPRASTGKAVATELTAKIAGVITPNGLPTSYRVQYGTSSPQHSTTSVALRPGRTNVSVSLRGLRTATKYRYRIVASNADGTSYGKVRSFKTLPKLKARFAGLAHSYHSAQVTRSGLKLAVTCNQPCRATGTLTLGAAQAVSLGLGNHSLSIGTGTARIGRAGTFTLTLRLTAAAATALGSTHHASPELRIRISPIGSGTAVQAQSHVTLAP